MRRLIYIMLMPALIGVMLGRAVAAGDDLTETHRIRITNAADGAVQVSIDHGDTYLTVGRVTRPATTCTRGFAASAFAQDGRVAAIAVHALRVRVGGDGNGTRVFSLIPREFAKPGGEFGTGEVAGASGIYTDIPAGTAIFRNLAPLVGNPVFLEERRGLRPLPSDYTPKPGDVLVIIAQVHNRRPNEIIIENRAGGEVRAVYDDATEKIAIVQHPVRGIGRFDATEYTGVGCINTNHTGVVTISTAPLSSTGTHGPEPRGGFQILPSKHAVHIGIIPQYMVVAPMPDSPALEGSPLLFSGYIGLDDAPGSRKDSYRVDVRTGGSNDWQPLATLLGKHDHALDDYSGSGKSITDIRLTFPRHSENWRADQVKIAADAYVKTKYGSKPPTRGMITVRVPDNLLGTTVLASLYIDGVFRGISGATPFMFSVDVDKLPPGEHCVEVRATDATGTVLKNTRQWFYTTAPSVRTESANAS